MKAKLYKVLDQYHLYDGDKAIATTIIGNPMLLPNLSKQNCNEIFGVVDVEKLADEYLEKHFSTGLDTNYIQNIVSDGIKYGFNKAMELNKDKLFTVEDMATMMLEAVKWANDGGEIDAQKLLDNTIQSLQQPTEIDVVIVMENYGYCEGCRKAGILHCAHADTCGYAETRERPKLDSERQLIIKKI
jgi:hypothetical protein